MNKFLATWGTLVAFIVLGGAALAAINGQVQERVKAELAMCERIKQDRIDNARAWTQLQAYLDDISKSGANEKVRSAADQAEILVSESANQLRTRILECEPLILDGKELIDERMLREAKGQL